MICCLVDCIKRPLPPPDVRRLYLLLARLKRGCKSPGGGSRCARGLLREADAQHIGALRGFIDEAGQSCIMGWAQNTDSPEAPVCLDIIVDCCCIGQVLANRYRGDLAQAGLGSGRHSFIFTPPAGVLATAPSVEVRRSLDGAPLLRSAEPSDTRHRARRDSG
jgi:hypothetical protein